MSSRALAIRDAVIALLETPALSGIGSGGVSNDPDYAFTAADLPVVAVFLGDEVTSPVSFTLNEHDLMLNVRIISKGTDPLGAGDPLMVLAYARIVADKTIGGLALDVHKTGTRRSRDVLEVPVANTDLEFAVNYHTPKASLEG